MEQKIKQMLDIIKSNCDTRTYVDALLLVNDGHYDDVSGAYKLSILQYRNGSPKDAGVELDTLYEITKAKAEELGLPISFSPWDAMVFVSKAFSIHWSTVSGDLETAVTIAVEDMASTFCKEA